MRRISKKLINIIAIILVAATIIFIGWAIWRHFSSKNTSTTSSGSGTSEQIDESEKSTKTRSAEEETTVETSSSEQASSSQTTQVETATELPKTGFDPNNR